MAISPRKIVLYLALLCGSYVIWRFGFQQPTDYTSSKHWSSLINDPRLQLRGLIHVLKTYPENVLPDVADGALLTPHALGLEEHVTPREWSRRLMATDEETPLVVFSKTYCPYSRSAKKILQTYDLEPEPFIIEVDLRNDSMRIKSYLGRLTGRATFPNVILHAQSIGGADDILQLDGEGSLKTMLEDGGLVVQGHKE